MHFEISRSFDTRVEKSPRVLEVAEAFGLGLTDAKFVVYDRMAIEVRQGDVVYITGQSGSGKSLLLRDLATRHREAGLKVADLAEIPLHDEPLVDQIGESTEHALKLLSQAGLNDAYLFIRKPSELSDGQKYRFKLAKLIESGAQVWVADEFAAVLDRDMAKIVAHNVAKSARQMGATLIVATTHTDLLPYFGATLAIEKLYGNRVDLTRLTWGEGVATCQAEGCETSSRPGSRFCDEHQPVKAPVVREKKLRDPNAPKREKKPRKSATSAPVSDPQPQEQTE